MSNERAALFVLSELDEENPGEVTVRGIYSTTEELHALLKRLGIYDHESSDRKVVLEPCYDDCIEGIDPDKFATSQVVIVDEDEDEDLREETNFYVWDAAKSRATYEPLKLYWCTTDDGGEDWFIVAHTAAQAALKHAANEGYDPKAPAAEFIMLLSPELQDRFHDMAVGWPSSDVLIACGAKLIREESPRVVEIDGRSFGEGMMDHMINQARAGVRPERN